MSDAAKPRFPSARDCSCAYFDCIHKALEEAEEALAEAQREREVIVASTQAREREVVEARRELDDERQTAARMAMERDGEKSRADAAELALQMTRTATVDAETQLQAAIERADAAEADRDRMAGRVVALEGFVRNIQAALEGEGFRVPDDVPEVDGMFAAERDARRLLSAPAPEAAALDALTREQAHAAMVLWISRKHLATDKSAAEEFDTCITTVINEEVRRG